MCGIGSDLVKLLIKTYTAASSLEWLLAKAGKNRSKAPNLVPGAEEVAHMRGGGGAGLTQTYGSEVLHCLWFGKVRPKKKKKKKVTTS